MLDRLVISARQILCIYMPLAIFVGPTLVFAQGQPRPFADGVLKEVPPIIDVRDTFSLQMPLPGRNTTASTFNKYPDSETLHARTQNIVFYRDVFQYEFSFLSLRQLTCDIPTPDKKMRKKTVWYLVYRVRNLGVNVSYEKAREQAFGHEIRKLNANVAQLKPEAMQGRFIPEFSLEGWVQDNETKEYRRVKYAEQILPTAVVDIQNAEDPNRPLLSTPEFLRTELPVENAETGDGVWGVVTFTDVNPKIDFVSLYVQGITNAYRISRPDPEAEPQFKRKTLQINFWRPGDEINEAEDSIQYGVPFVADTQRQIEIAQKYQLPGPHFEIYEQDKATNITNLVAEAPIEVDMDTLDAPVLAELNDAKLPESVKTAMSNYGIEIPDGAAVTRNVLNTKWTVNFTADGKERIFQIRMVPQFWEKDGDEIRFIKSLEYMWIYR